MKAPVSWLREYVPIELPLNELAQLLTMSGTEVGGIEQTGSEWGPVVVGHATRVNPHPNADRLRLVTVDYGGDETAEVVCGAPNVAAGQKIAYAAIGAMLTDPYKGGVSKLKKARIRGVVSTGMVCSQKELGLSDEHEGILVLPDNAPIGTPLVDYLGEAILDLDLTPNRGDCLGMLGIAREVAALTGQPFSEPDRDYPEEGPEVGSLASVRIDDPDLCARYTATVLQNVKLGPSPDWLAARLAAQGQASINNIVDITNYVMFEYGQPLHAFDLDGVGNHAIIVRRAYAGERLTTLDDVDRELDDDMLVIADPEKAIGLAGVMGGGNTEITKKTVNVLLESATFNGSNNRKTASALEMNTEATLRFEKGLLPGLSERAVRRATRLILQIAGGTAARGILDAYPNRDAPPIKVELTRGRLSRVMGVDYTDEQVLSTLESIGLEVSLTPDGYMVEQPYWRPDINIPEDVVEEVARIIGFEEIPATGISDEIPAWSPQPDREFKELIKDTLAELGMREVINYPTSTPEKMARVRPPDAPPPIGLKNPIASDHEFLRTTLRESVLDTVARNTHTWRSAIALFEIGPEYLDRGEGLPEERQMLVGAATGERADKSWDSPEGAFDFYDAKGIVEGLLERFGATGEFEPVTDATFIPGRCASITVNGKRIGVVGEVAPDIMDTLDSLRPRVPMFEIDINAFAGAVGGGGTPVSFGTFTRYPESYRDLALVVDEATPAAAVVQIIERNRLVMRAGIVDVFRGEGVGNGKKSLAVRISYQSATKTLTGEEVTKAENGILMTLEKQLDATRRG